MTENYITTQVVEKKRAALYCRVSTYEQAQGNTSSLDGQEDYLRNYCRDNNFDVFNVYRDTKSGKSLEREKIQELLNDAEEHKFDVVVATKLDRLSRSVRDFLEFDYRLNKLNVDIVITTQFIDTTIPAGKMNKVMLMVFAEFERDMIADRTREKLYYQAQKGHWGGGHTPLGYDAVDKKLVINTAEAKLITRIYEMYIEGKSTSAIAKVLNDEGYKPKSRNFNGVKTVSDYDHEMIARILKNPLYLGIITIKVKKEKGKLLTAPRIEQFKGVHEAIIDQKTFDLAKLKFSSRKKNNYTDYQDSELILLQKLICGECGSRMTTSFANRDGQRYYYYKCSHKMKKGASKCNSRDVPAKEFEDFALKLVNTVGGSDAFFDYIFEEVNKNSDDELDKLKVRINELQNNLKVVNAEAERLLQFIMNNDAIADKGLISEKINVITQKKKYIEIEIDATKSLLNNHSELSITKEELKEIYLEIPNLLTTMDKLGQKRLIDCLINSITWNLKKGDKEGEIEISFRGDGRIKQKWVNRVNPLYMVSSFHLGWLREQDSNLQPFG